jgi:predicted secreted protein
MTITSAIVLLSVYWFIILFIILPINVTTQNDEKNIIEGTAPSSPVNPNLKRKFSITTLVSVILWIPTCLIINLFY